ncbi:MAG TPA: hypothetical protein VIC62_01560, partial [Nakamurella sp.]
MTARHGGVFARLLTIVRLGAAVTAAMALTALIAIGPPGSARAATATDAYNQMTGAGSTNSALTVKWTDGLLNAQNQPITAGDTTDLNPDADRAAYAANPTSATSPLSFMDASFKDLQVTVSQTGNITHQGITVSWTGGGASSPGAPSFNYLQIMECYGDAATGPSPEGCEYGSPGMLGPVANSLVGDRSGYNCGTGAVPSTNPANTPPGPYGDPSMGCDPYEPGTETPSHCLPNATGNTVCGAPADYYSIPFVPADDPTGLVYQQTNLGQYFSPYNTNEVQVAYTAADGTGQRQFETLTAKQSLGLGCGETESNGQTRDCWLVIVPRGTFEPNGFQVSPTASGLFSAGKFLDSSPLSAGNWAQRIQIHLGYAPLNADCPPTVIPDSMVGTEVAYRAVASWQQALNQAAQCSRVYSYTATTENEATTDLAGSNSGGAGLAFTTIPMGSEAARDGLQPTTLPKILYAPVAVTALDFGFDINEASYLTTAVKLTPALTANALTQVYTSELPDYDPNALLNGPAWAAKNPLNITYDPAFQKLNPTSEIPSDPTLNPIAPLYVGGKSTDNQRVWQWIQSDAATASWLNGGTNPADPVTPDADYLTLKLGTAPAGDSFAPNYKGTLTCSQVVTDPTTCTTGRPVVNNKPTESRGLGSGDLLPVATNYDQAASTVLSASDTGFTRTWDTSAKDPSGYPGWFRQVGTELAGQTFMWTLNDMPDLAAYGLISAALCNPSGATCDQPSTADVNAALNSATKDSAGLLQVNPAKVPSGAYPLVDVVYAAVSVKQSASALSDYADFIAYAAKKGQVTGSAPGDLPPGYLPLTSSLQAQAQSVVKQLRALAGPASTPIPTVTHSATPTRSASPTVSATQGGGTQGPTAPVTQPGATPTGAGPGGSTLPGTGGSTPGGTGGGPTGATSGSTCTATAAATGTATASASPSSTVTP